MARHPGRAGALLAGAPACAGARHLGLVLALIWPQAGAAEGGWPAVGLITHGTLVPGAAVCTGTLVAPDLEQTAAHCVGDDPSSLRFAAGWAAGRAVAEGKGREVTREEGTGPAGDLALVRLEAAMGVVPLPPARGTAGTLVAVAYRRDDTSRPVTLRDCAVVVADPPLLALDCAVVSGNSGAPLLVRGPGGWQVAAVLVAQVKSPGPIRAVAAIPDAALRAVIAGR
jgi:protease YdgD